jgi:hypothetical protein
MLDLLSGQQVNDRFPALLPAGTRLAHKTGNLPGVVHDAGVIWTPAGPRILAALAEGVPDDGHAATVIQRLALLVYGGAPPSAQGRSPSPGAPEEAGAAVFHEVLPPGTRLNPGDTLFSRRNDFRLDMQTDGDLVLSTADMVPLWASNTAGEGTYAVMQVDGNLVVYDVADRPVFASGTDGNPGAFLVCQDDGNLVIYRGGAPPSPATALWATGTHARADRA